MDLCRNYILKLLSVYDILHPPLSYFGYTGAVYCDVHLKNAGFNGEAMRSGSVLLVKTHKANVSWTDMNKPEFTPKVCIITSLDMHWSYKNVFVIL